VITSVTIEQIDPNRPHHFYVGVLIAAFSFRFVWRWFPRLGALLTWVGIAIAVDDAFTHSTGINTPGDWVEYLLADALRWLGLLE